MSYSMAGALQSAVYDALITDTSLSQLVGTHIYDSAPTGTVAETYVSLGDERVQDASDQLVNGAIHRFDVYVRTTQPGFADAKTIGAAISDVLHNAQLTLTRGRLVFLRFEKAEARRIEKNSVRQVLLRFRARVDEED